MAYVAGISAIFKDNFADGYGITSHDTMIAILMAACGISTAQFEDVWTMYDDKSDGTVNYEDFFTWIFDDGATSKAFEVSADRTPRVVPYLASTSLLQKTHEHLSDEITFVSGDIKQNASASASAPEESRANRRCMLNAFTMVGASEGVSADREFVIGSIKQNPFSLAGANEELRFDPKLVLQAIKQNAFTLTGASGEFHADHDAVTAINKDGSALSTAAEELRVVSELVEEAMDKVVNALKCASEELGQEDDGSDTDGDDFDCRPRITLRLLPSRFVKRSDLFAGEEEKKGNAQVEGTQKKSSESKLELANERDVGSFADSEGIECSHHSTPQLTPSDFVNRFGLLVEGVDKDAADTEYQQTKTSKVNKTPAKKGEIREESKAEDEQNDASQSNQDTRPCFLPSADEVTEEMRRRQRQSPQQWTLSIKQWIDVMNHCREHSKYVESTHEKRFVTMYDVTNLFTIPWTRGTGCGISVLISREESRPAQLMLSHAWGEGIEELYDCVTKHIENEVDSLAALWFCCFANYQAEDIPGVKLKDQLALDPFREVITCLQLKRQYGGYGMLAIHTTREDLYSRLWCLYEIYGALKEDDVQVAFSLSEQYANAVLEKMNILSVRDASNDTFSQATQIRITTAAATCSRLEDYTTIVDKILFNQNDGGFQEIDKQISTFRDRVLKDIFLKGLQSNLTLLKYAPKDAILEFLEREIASSNTGSMLKILEHIPPKCWAEEDNLLNDSPMEVRSHREVVLEAIKHNPYSLEFAAGEFRADPEMLSAAFENGFDLRRASEGLRADRAVVLEAVKRDGWALQVASEELLADRIFVLQAVKHNGWALKSASEEMRADREVVLEAVKQAGTALQFIVEDLAERAIDLELQSWEEVKRVGGKTHFYHRVHKRAQVTDPRPALSRKHNLYLRMMKLRSDREVVLAAVKQNGLALEYASQESCADHEVVLAAVQQNGMALKVASGELRADLELVLAAVKQNGSALEFASNDLRNDLQLVQEALKQDGEALRFASEEVRGRYKMLDAVKQDGRALKRASKELRADREVVLAAIQQNGSALKYASKLLRADREVVLMAVDKKWEALQYASKELRADQEAVLAAVKQNFMAWQYASKELLLAAIKQNGLTLQYASEAMRGDLEVVLAAVKQNGLALYYASNSLRNNQILVLEAIKQDGEALKFASEHVRARYEMLDALNENGMALERASKELRADKEVVLAAVTRDGWALRWASEELRADREVVLAAIEQNGSALKYASKELRADRELVLMAINLKWEALQHASQEMCADQEAVLAAVKQNSLAWQYASKELVLAAIKQNGLTLQYASEELRADRAVVEEAVRKNGAALNFASEELRADREVVLLAINQHPFSLQFASAELRANRGVVLETVKRCGGALRFASALRADRGVVLEAVKQDGWALRWASEELRADRDVVLAAIKQNKIALQYASKELRKDPVMLAEATR